MYHAYLPVEATAGADATLWNATITAGLTSDEGIIGWDPDHPAGAFGSINYHTPGSSIFVLKNQNYNVTSVVHSRESSFYALYLDRPIPQPARDAVYVVLGNIRCSPAVADAGSSYVWTYRIGSSPFSDDSDTIVAVLYNENYLTLNGPDTVTLAQGASYVDQGATTPDGAIVRSNATDLDTSISGTHKIKYTATKGCNTLDTAIRTVEVQDTTKPSFASAALDYDTREMDNHI